MKPRFLAVAAVASSIGILAACGGAKQDELFATPPASDIGSEASPTDPAETSSSGGSSGTASGSSGATSTSSSGGSTSSSGGSSGTTSSSGGSTSGSSSGGTTTPKGVWCGEDKNGDSVYCKSGTSCCASETDPMGSGLECTSGAGSCAGGLSIKCDDQTDCPSGQVCCGMFDPSGGYKSVECSTACANAGTTKAVRFCDHDAAVDECKAWGKTCQWSQGLPGYAICK